MSIVPLNLGSAPNDGNGQDLRSGGQVINANFAELDQRTATAQAAAEGAQSKADAAIPASQKGQPNGVAGLDANGTVPAVQLPSYVDDVLEFESFATLPATGETGKIYITIDTNSQYRWSGTQYVLLTASPGSTDAVPEGAVNKYWTLARTLGSVLTGLVTTNPAVVAATDTVLAAFGKLQRQITDLASSKASKGANNDITSLAGLTTPLAVDQGGTGSASGVPEMTGASESVAGAKGLVPAPVAGATRFLSSLGTWLAINASASWGSISGTLSDQADLSSALNGKIASSLIDFVFIYPNGGSASSPANISLNTRLINANPFPGSAVICEVECLVSGVWETPGWVSSSTQSPNSIGVRSSQRRGGSSDEIVTQSGSIANITSGGYTGGSYSGAYTTAALPVRVKVWKVKS